MKHLLKLSSLTPGEVAHILDVADRLKAQQKAGGTPALLAGKSVALMFSKASTRTRTSFEVGVYQLGGLGHYMNASTELQSGRGEPLKDTARVLGRYYDCIVWRTYRQCDLEEFAELAGVPVINGLTDYAHPCQVLADLMTIRERRGTSGRAEALLCGRRQQHGQQPHRGRPALRHVRHLRLPPGLPPRRRRGDVRPSSMASSFPPHHRPRRGRERCRCGGDGGVEQLPPPAPPDSRAAPAGLCGLPAHRQAAGKRQARRHGAALPARPPWARRSPPPCSSSTPMRSSTRPRTASTSRKPCWPF